MRKKTKRMLGRVALAAGAFGAAGAFLKNKGRGAGRGVTPKDPANVWARPGMTVTFRAELMPGSDREKRTARVKEVLASGRVLLHEVAGEHARNEFDAVS